MNSKIKVLRELIRKEIRSALKEADVATLTKQSTDMANKILKLKQDKAKVDKMKADQEVADEKKKTA